ITDKDSLWTQVSVVHEKRRFLVRKPRVTVADFFVPMRNYNTDKGLSIASIASGFQDRMGNLWFGTNGGGVTRYDGKSSVTFTADQGLGNNAIVQIMEDTLGNIWFACNGGGLSKYDGRSIRNYTKKDGLISDELHTIITGKNGDIWVGTRGGINRFDGNQFFNYTERKAFYGFEVLSTVNDNNGKTWFTTLQGGVGSFDGNDFHNYSIAQGLPDISVRCSFMDHKGNLWFGTRIGSISKFDGVSFTNYRYEENPNTHQSASIHSINEDNAGTMWFGTFTAGVKSFDGKKFSSITTKQGLKHNIVNSITKDKSGNLWLGTGGGGADCYSGSAFTIFTTQQGLPDHTVRNIIQDKDGNYWFGTNAGGACRYDGKYFTTYSKSQGLNNERVNRVFEDSKGNIWFCNGGGACRFDGSSLTNFTAWQGLANDAVRSIVEDKQGNIWFGTEMGLSKYDGQYFYSFRTQQGLPNNNVRDMVIDENGIFWLGCHDGGLVKYDGKSFLTLDTAQGLVNNFIFNLTMDSRGNLWVCTGDGGISILRKDVIKQLANPSSVTPDSKLFENFTTREGLSDNVVYDAVEDKQGNIIIGTNIGFTVVKGGLHPERPIRRDQLEYFNLENGYPVADANTQSMYVDREGIIWAGTGDKLIRFDYSAIRKDLNPPVVKIRSMKVNNETIGWYNLLRGKSARADLLPAIVAEEKMVYNRTLGEEERDSLQNMFGDINFDSVAPFYPLPLNLTLPYNHNNVTFDFAAIEPARPFLVRYQYMLEGYDRAWSPLTQNSFASFGNINEGRYTFHVKALSPDGVWSTPVSYTFKVLPPWHRSLWAYVAYILGFIGLLFGFYRSRIKQLERKQTTQLQTVIATQEEERKRISRDLHDDVGTKLSALKLFLSSLKMQVENKEQERAQQLAVNSEQLINETIRDVREMLLNLSPGVLEEFGFVVAIEGLVNKINQAGAINIELTTFGLTKNLQKEYELALYRITQELINNVLKHSQAKNVSLQIGYREEKIIIMIEDDGKGFKIEDHKDGYGLKNLAARTKLLNGTMNIDSQIGKGTSVSIEVPYKFN
ncbi:MAG TPA: two-component regulator propeller domain-containing protein, partial [Chitinophagaceae bacterium]